VQFSYLLNRKLFTLKTDCFGSRRAKIDSRTIGCEGSHAKSILALGNLSKIEAIPSAQHFHTSFFTKDSWFQDFYVLVSLGQRGASRIELTNRKIRVNLPNIHTSPTRKLLPTKE
jgi:hypothetical protein